jgi:O-antigen/teichoic acid export membrane protein
MNNNKNKWQNIKDNFFALKGLVILGSTDILSAALGVGFWFILASFLLVEEYGELHFVIAIASIAYSSCILGSNNSFLVYSSKFPKIIPTLMVVSLIFTIISSIIVYVIFQKFEITFFMFSLIIFEISITITVGKKLYTKYSKMILIQKTLQFILGISLYFIFGIHGVIYGIALSSLILIIIFYKEIKLYKIDFSLLKQKKEFLFNNHALNVISTFRKDIDKILIVPLFGFALLGNFALSLQFFAILMIFANISFKYLLPKDIEGDQNKKLKKILILFSILISLLGYFTSPFLIENFFSQYSESIIPIQIISFAVIPTTISMILSAKILSLEKSRYLIIGTVAQLITIVLGVITLGTLFGIIGIAFSFLLSNSINAIILSIFNFIYIGKKKFEI